VSTKGYSLARIAERGSASPGQSSRIYGPMLADEHPGAFPLIRAVMRTSPVYRLERPAERWSVPEVTEVVLGGERTMVVPAQPGGGR
jgi:hypothetical protein